MKTIVIIDDDADDIDFLREAIHDVDSSINCVGLQDGQRAMEQLLKNEYSDLHCIFLDLNMPKIGGKQCLQRIRQEPALEKVPVIIYSTSKMYDRLLEAVQFEKVYFLTKPTKLSELRTYARLIIDNRWNEFPQVQTAD